MNICFDCFRKLEDGDIVNVDVTVCYKGYHGKKCNLSILIDPKNCFFLLIADLKVEMQVISMRHISLEKLMKSPDV